MTPDAAKAEFVDRVMGSVDPGPDIRWGINVLLEKIAEKFEGWDTYDIWRSDAAMVVRSFKNDATPPEQWRPIETAPKMKTLLLWAVTDIGEDGEIKNWKMATGSWHTGYENDATRTPWEWGGRQLMKYEIQPTHWQPLPAAPSVYIHERKV